MAAVIPDFISFLSELPFLLDKWKRYRFTNSEQLLEVSLQECKDSIDVTATFMMSNLMQNHNTHVLREEVNRLLEDLLKLIENHRIIFQNRQKWICIDQTPIQGKPVKEDLGNVGRPRFKLDEDQVRSLKTLGLSWSKISQMLGVSTKTLQRRREEFSSPLSTFTSINDKDLDEIILVIINNCPNAGEKMVMGSLISKSILVQRERLRNSLMRVDPNRSKNEKRRIYRRSYNVISPNALW